MYLLKKDTEKISLKRKRKKASRNHESLKDLLKNENMRFGAETLTSQGLFSFFAKILYRISSFLKEICILVERTSVVELTSVRYQKKEYLIKKNGLKVCSTEISKKIVNIKNLTNLPYVFDKTSTLFLANRQYEFWLFWYPIQLWLTAEQYEPYLQIFGG